MSWWGMWGMKRNGKCRWCSSTWKVPEEEWENLPECPICGGPIYRIEEKENEDCP